MGGSGVGPSRRIAIVTQASLGQPGGGVTSVVRWLRDGLRETEGYVVDVHELASSRQDPSSRRISSPSSWFRRSICDRVGDTQDIFHWGANAVEIEPMRYRPRAELSRYLRRYDLIQVVAGSPALASVVTQIGPPVAVQVASTLRWERASRRSEGSFALRAWRRGMTAFAAQAETRALRDANLILVENSVMLNYVRRVGQSKAVKAPPGVDTKRFRPPDVLWSPNGYLLSVCRLSEPRKGLNRLILGYAALVDLDIGCPPLVLAGHGDLPGTLRRQIAALGLSERVTVRRDERPQTLPLLYQGASVYVQTSHEEGLGLSLLEAMASGLPIVTTDTAGSREIVVPGVTGCVISQDSEESIARELAASTLGVLRQSGPSMALAARHRAIDQYSADATFARYLELYDSIMGTSRSHQSRL